LSPFSPQVPPSAEFLPVPFLLSPHNSPGPWATGKGPITLEARGSQGRSRFQGPEISPDHSSSPLNPLPTVSPNGQEQVYRLGIEVRPDPRQPPPEGMDSPSPSGEGGGGLFPGGRLTHGLLQIVHLLLCLLLRDPRPRQPLVPHFDEPVHLRLVERSCRNLAKAAQTVGLVQVGVRAAGYDVAMLWVRPAKLRTISTTCPRRAAETSSSPSRRKSTCASSARIIAFRSGQNSPR